MGQFWMINICESGVHFRKKEVHREKKYLKKPRLQFYNIKE